jgi:hypothetical protein
MLKIDFGSHLPGAHGELGDVLKPLTGGYLAAWTFPISAATSEVVYYLERRTLVTFCLHAFDQIILIAPLDQRACHFARKNYASQKK